jgi:hypothetical protein
MRHSIAWLLGIRFGIIVLWYIEHTRPSPGRPTRPVRILLGESPDESLTAEYGWYMCC